MSDDQKTASEPGSPSATTTISGKQLPPPDPKFGGVIKERASESKAMVAAARRAAEGRTQRAAHHDGRCGLRRAGHVRRRRSDPCAGSHRRKRAPLHEFPLHGALLALACGIDHGAQSSRGRLRGRGRNRDGISRLRLDHQEGERHHRRHPEGERIRDLVVRQGSQHALLSGDPGRALRPMAERDGLRVLLWLRRRRHQPVAAKPVPQYDAHLPL